MSIYCYPTNAKCIDSLQIYFFI